MSSSSSSDEAYQESLRANCFTTFFTTTTSTGNLFNNIVAGIINIGTGLILNVNYIIVDYNNSTITNLTPL